MRTALSLRVDSEGTALRAAAVAASSRRSAHLFVPVALNRQGVVTNPSGGVVALRTINQMVNRSAAQCRAKQRAAPRASSKIMNDVCSVASCTSTSTVLLNVTRACAPGWQ